MIPGDHIRFSTCFALRVDRIEPSPWPGWVQVSGALFGPTWRGALLVWKWVSDGTWPLPVDHISWGLVPMDPIVEASR